MFCGQGYGVFGYYRLTSRRVGSDENTISHFETIDCFFLEIVQLEGVLFVSTSTATVSIELTRRAGSGTSSWN